MLCESRFFGQLLTIRTKRCEPDSQTCNFDFQHESRFAYGGFCPCSNIAPVRNLCFFPKPDYTCPSISQFRSAHAGIMGAHSIGMRYVPVRDCAIILSKGAKFHFKSKTKI